MNELHAMIEKECLELGALLVAKNTDYNNTALNPEHLLSNLDAEERLKVRIDDKLTRLKHLLATKHQNFESIDDNIRDLNGYLILWRILRKIRGHSSGKN